MSDVAQVSPMPENETPTPEVPVEGQPPAELDSAKWAALAKREQKLVHRDLAIKKKEEELAAKQKDLESKLTPFQEFEVLRSKDPVAALRSLGFSETEIFNWMADSAPKELTPEQKAEAAAQKVLDQYKKEQLESQSKAERDREAEVLTRFKGRIKSALTSNPEKYKACVNYGPIAEEAAFNFIKQVAKDTGEVITIDEAFQAVEDFYRGEYESLSGIFKPAAEPTEEPVIIKDTKEKQDVPRGTPKTLTNAATPTLASTVNKQESREQKRERLINQIRQTGLRK